MQVIPNRGQWPEQVAAASKFGNGTLYFENDGLSFLLFHPEDMEKFHAHQNSERRQSLSDSLRGHFFKMTFLNANSTSQIRPVHKKSGHVNYFLGNDRRKWAGHIPLYKELKYLSVYSGIDFHYFEKNGRLEYDIHIAPGADPGQIAILYRHTEGLHLDDRGAMHIQTSVNEMIEHIPFSYQINQSGDTLELRAQYLLKGDTVRFNFPDGYDPKMPIVIDPILAFSSYSGSYSDNFGFTATFDTAGYLYGGSMAFGNRYPTTPGAFRTTFSGATDVAITKFSKDGSQLIYSTYIGGSSTETPNSLFVGPGNELFIYGVTGSADFPMSLNAYDTSFNGGRPVNYSSNGTFFPDGSDIYICRLSAGGDSLLASTYLGGTKNDGINAGRRLAPSYPDTSVNLNYGDIFRGEIIVDGEGGVYVATCSQSADFPLSPDAFQTTFGGRQDGVVLKMNSTLDSLQWSTYYGGSDIDACFSVKLTDDESTMAVTGATVSKDLPVSSGALFENFRGGVNDGFIALFNNQMHTLNKATYFGGSGLDISYFIDFDFDGDIYITGNTDSPDLNKIGNPAQYSNSGQFIARLDGNLEGIKMLTRFGSGKGLPEMSPTAFLVDDCKNIYISGWGGATNESSRSKVPVLALENMPLTSDAFQDTTDGSDFYFIVFSENADSLVYASYFGGAISHEHVDGGTSRFDKDGIIYQAVCAGCGGNSDFPTTPNAWSRENKSTNCNLGVIKFEFQLIEVQALAKAGPTLNGCAPLEVQFENLGRDGVYYLWDFGTGDSSHAENPKYTFEDSGQYLVRFVIKPGKTCRYLDSTSFHVTVLSRTEALFDFSPDPPILGQEVRFENHSIGGDEDYWFLDGQLMSNDQDWRHRFNMLGRYEVCLLILNDYCEDSTCRELIFPLIDVPTAFSPNGDGENDTLFVRGFGVEQMDFRLYNRWGQLLFETDNLKKGWDGSFNGVAQEMDVYVYTLNAILEDGKAVDKKGNITLIR